MSLQKIITYIRGRGHTHGCVQRLCHCLLSFELVMKQARPQRHWTFILNRMQHLDPGILIARAYDFLTWRQGGVEGNYQHSWLIIIAGNIQGHHKRSIEMLYFTDRTNMVSICATRCADSSPTVPHPLAQAYPSPSSATTWPCRTSRDTVHSRVLSMPPGTLRP